MGRQRPDHRCIVCGAAELSGISGAYCERALLCAACGHVFVAELPSAEELEEVYGSYGYDSEGAEGPSFLEGILDETVATFAPHRAANRLLDVGFGAGGFLRAARRAGWDTSGIEVSKAAVERARTQDLGNIFHADFTTAELDDGTFDVIVMSEILEHLNSPESFLARAARLLRPGGLLYATTPHGRGVSGRLLGASWSVLRPPEHLQLFSVASMRVHLTNAGFPQADVYTQSVLPHELVGAGRKAARELLTALRRTSRSETSSVAVPGGSAGPPSPSGTDRVGRSYALNARLRGSLAGRLAKRGVNRAIRLSGLGDSLRVRALR